MRIDGIKKLKKEDLAKNTKAMIMIMNPENARGKVFDDVKIRKPRAKELLPRKEYDRAEDRLRPVVIKELRKRGCEVSRVENSISGDENSSLGDLWVFCLRSKWSGWVEVKTPFGVMSKGQKKFKENCKLTNSNYIEFREWKDLEIIFEKRDA